jgi:hypothetical protein
MCDIINIGIGSYREGLYKINTGMISKSFAVLFRRGQKICFLYTICSVAHRLRGEWWLGFIGVKMFGFLKGDVECANI